MNVTFRELLQDSSLWEQTITLLETKYYSEGFEEENITRDEIQHTYIKVVMKLLSFPCDPQDFSIFVSLVPKDNFNELEYVDVCVTDNVSHLHEDMSSLPWRSLVDLPIIIDDTLMSLSDAEILCEILWEITIWGFSEEMEVFEARDKFTTFVSGFLRKDLDRN